MTDNNTKSGIRQKMGISFHDRMTEYLKKLENHTSALAVNLLDNSETTYTLKRYTALTLPDRSE
jgi:hypothetical protein